MKPSNRIRQIQGVLVDATVELCKASFSREEHQFLLAITGMTIEKALAEAREKARADPSILLAALMQYLDEKFPGEEILQ